MADRDIPERKNIKIALRALGMSVRQADAFLRGGHKALIGETAAENAELKEQLEALANSLK